jgi:hypothetical protein
MNGALTSFSRIANSVMHSIERQCFMRYLYEDSKLPVQVSSELDSNSRAFAVLNIQRSDDDITIVLKATHSQTPLRVALQHVPKRPCIAPTLLGGCSSSLVASKTLDFAVYDIWHHSSDVSALRRARNLAVTSMLRCCACISLCGSPKKEISATFIDPYSQVSFNFTRKNQYRP